MSKHTPGPWEATCEAVSGWKGNAFNVQIAAGEKLIASYDTSYVEYPEADEENAANARLIAAAPELLEACEEALGALNGAEYALPSYVVGALERAIAKATGEQQ